MHKRIISTINLHLNKMIRNNKNIVHEKKLKLHKNRSINAFECTYSMKEVTKLVWTALNHNFNTHSTYVISMEKVRGVTFLYTYEIILLLFGSFFLSFTLQWKLTQ